MILNRLACTSYRNESLSPPSFPTILSFSIISAVLAEVRNSLTLLLLVYDLTMIMI